MRKPGRGSGSEMKCAPRDTPSMNLFDEPAELDLPRESLGPCAVVLRRFAHSQAPALLHALQAVTAAAPFRYMTTPGGFRMSVAMTNCGAAGWVTDRRGYRYAAEDPETGRAWPALPAVFVDLADRAARAAGYRGFVPDACLIN